MAKVNQKTFDEIRGLLQIKGIKQSVVVDILKQRGIEVSHATVSRIKNSKTIEAYKMRGVKPKPKVEKTVDFDKHNSLVSLLRVIAENTAETNRLLKTLPLKKRGIFQ